MKRLLELEEKLIKAREELEKQMGMMDPMSGMPGGTAASGGVNTAMGKAEDGPENHRVTIKHVNTNHHDKGSDHEFAVHRNGKPIGVINHEYDGSIGGSLKEKYHDSDVERAAHSKVKHAVSEMSKKEHCDEEEDKKMIEEKLDEHNEKKHGEPKDEDSAMKAEMIKFDANGQWSLDKSQGNIKYPSAKDLEYPDSPAIRAAEAKEKEMQVQMPERKRFKGAGSK